MDHKSAQPLKMHYTSYPNFMEQRELPYNMYQLVDDMNNSHILDSKGEKFNEEDTQMAKLFAARCLVRKLSAVCDERERKSRLVLLCWIRCANITCIDIMDYNLVNVILEYQNPFRFDGPTAQYTTFRWVFFVKQRDTVDG